MAKRSDFAQKLLEDLRLRKERLASSSQSSNCSNSSMAITDAYSYARQNYRGSKGIRTNDMIGSRTGSARNGSNANGRPSFGAESSQQHIVPYNNGRSQASHQMVDLSMALAFALENGGKINRTDSSPRSSMLEFLQRIGMKSIDHAKIEARSNSARMIQIEEISKGVQRMNQIIRACSNSGVNFDKKSIQIGKELLKGATDLEKSLKMLVDLQEASEFVVKPHRKNRIKLLEEDEEEDATNVAEEWKLDRPRFSGRAGLNQRSVRSFSTSAEHKSQPSSSEHCNNKQEKARIPNVIAKLMGLEKLPEGEGLQKKLESKPIKIQGGSLRRAMQETDEIFNKKERSVVEANPFVLNASFKVVKERNLPAEAGFEAAIEDDKPRMVKKNLEASHLLPQKRQPEKQSSSSQTKRSPNNVHVETEKPFIVKKRVLAERDRSLKQNSQVTKHKVNALSLKILSKSSPEKKLNKKSERKIADSIQQSELFPNVKRQGELVRERSSAESNSHRDANDWNVDRNFSPRKPESESRRARARIMQVVDEKAVHVQKGKVSKAQNKRNGPLNNMTRSTRHQSSVLREVKPTRLEELVLREDEAKPDVIKPNRSEAQGQLLEKEGDLCTGLEEPETLAPSDDLCQNETVDDQLNQVTVFEDTELKYTIDVANEIDETTFQETKPAEAILTESENSLKQILIKSQLFLNTAEALFRLDIPITTLHSSTADQQQHHQNDEQRNVVLDCGYELMRRKGRRQELTVHPNYGKASIGFVAMRSFESLVKELSKDFERLRVYGRNGKEGCEAQEYLAGMQESDVHGKEPDVNCMWDLGWNDRFFAFFEVDEVVRDVEKFVLNGLLDEITADIFLSYV